MRMILAVVLLVAGVALTACAVSKSDDFDTAHKPEITVFFMYEVTAQQQAAVEAKVRALPGVDTVQLETAQEAAERAMEQLKGDPSLSAGVANAKLPPSLRFITKNLKSYDAIRHSSFADEVRKMPGVADVFMQCATVEECKTTLTPPPVPTSTR
jgi:cell division protein FtsX